MTARGGMEYHRVLTRSFISLGWSRLILSCWELFIFDEISTEGQWPSCGEALYQGGRRKNPDRGSINLGCRSGRLVKRWGKNRNVDAHQYSECRRNSKQETSRMADLGWGEEKALTWNENRCHFSLAFMIVLFHFNLHLWIWCQECKKDTRSLPKSCALLLSRFTKLIRAQNENLTKEMRGQKINKVTDDDE